MLGICPNVNHPDYVRAVEAFGKDTALLLYDQLGGRAPSKSEVELLQHDGTLSPTHNQRVWDVNKAEKLINNNTWQTTGGIKTVDSTLFYKKAAEDKKAELRRKYYKDGISFDLGAGVQVEGKWRYSVQPIDKRYVGDLNDLHELHIVRNLQREEISAEEAARIAETYSTPFRESIPVDEDERMQGLFGTDGKNSIEFQATTISKMLEFLEAAKVPIEFVDKFDSTDKGYFAPALAFANFAKMTVQMLDGDVEQRAKAWHKYPEEAAHIWYELLKKNTDLKKALWNSAKTIAKRDALFEETFERTGNIRISSIKIQDMDRLQNEAIGQLIAETIKQIEIEESRNFLQKFFDWIADLIGLSTTDENEPFYIAAKRILNSDLADLLTVGEYLRLRNSANVNTVLTDVNMLDPNNLNEAILPDEIEKTRQKFIKQVRKTKLLKKTLSTYLQVPSLVIYETEEAIERDALSNFDNQAGFTLHNIDGIINRAKTEATPFFVNIPADKDERQEKYEKIPSLSSVVKVREHFKNKPVLLKAGKFETISGVNKTEYKIYNIVLELIKKENPNLSKISVDDYLTELHAYLSNNYLLGFEHVKEGHFGDLADYRVNLTFKHNAYKVRHKRIGIRFNNKTMSDKVIDRKTHWDTAPTAFGNLTYFYSKAESENPDIVLIHEIQSDVVESMRNSFKELKKYVESPSSLVYSKSYYEDILKNDIRETNINVFNYLNEIVNHEYTLTLDHLLSYSGASLYEFQSIYLDKVLSSKVSSPIRRIVNNLNTLAHSGVASNILFKYKSAETLEEIERVFRETQEEGRPLYTKFQSSLEEYVQLKGGENALARAEDKITDAKKELDDAYVNYVRLNDIINKKLFFNYVTPEMKREIKRIIDNSNSRLDALYTNPTISDTDVKQIEREASLDIQIVFNSVVYRISKEYGLSIKQREALGESISKGLKVFHKKKGELQLSQNLGYMTLLMQRSMMKDVKSNILTKRINVLDSIKQQKALGSLIEFYNVLDEETYFNILKEIFSSGVRTREQVVRYAEEVIRELKSNLKNYDPEKINAIKNNLHKKLYELQKDAFEVFSEKYDKEDIVTSSPERIKQEQLDLEKNLAFFNPLVHELIQRHIREYGKSMPMYFTGYEATTVTQGTHERALKTAVLYTGQEEIEKGLSTKTGPVYAAMGDIPGITLKYVDHIPGIQGDPGGYLVDLSKYEFDTPMLSKSLPGIKTEPETYPGLEQKIAVLRKSIPYIENVILDDTIPTIAMVEKGGKTIRINPKLMTTDSIGHEYGHVLIDMLGGMSNPMIKQGREQLKGTKIEQEVIAAYPELAHTGDDRLDKEILTTAVGIKAAELFKDLDIQNKWLRWVVRFFRRIRAMVGIESSVVLKLAEKLVSGTELATKETATSVELAEGMYMQGTPSIYDQHSKTLGDTMTLLDEMISREEKIQRKAAVTLQKKLDVYSKKGRHTAEYKTLEDALPRMQGTNPTKSLIHMIRFAVESTKAMNDQYLAYLKAERYPKNSQVPGEKPTQLTVKLLSEWRTSVAAWDMLGDLRQLYADTKKQVEAYGEESDKKMLKQLFADNKALLQAIIGEAEFKTLTANKAVGILDLLIPLLDKAIEVKNDIQKLYVEKGKELIVDFLTPYTSHVKVFKRDQFEREWLNLSPDEQKATPKEKFILEQMASNMDEIEKDTRDLILRELEKADGDVGFLTRYVDTILDSRDVISSALARTVYTVHEKSHREALDWKYKFIDVLTPLEKQLGRTASMPDEVFWDWLYETDPKTGRPMQNIIAELPSLLINDYWDYHNMIMSDLYKDNNGNVPTYAQKQRLIRKWIEENAPRRKDEWLSAQAALGEELHEKKLITEKELKRFIGNSKVSHWASKIPTEKLFKNQEAVDIVQSFYSRNTWTFRDPSGYYKKINTKWDALQAMREKGLKNGVQTDARVVFYDFLMDVIDEAAARLPSRYALTTELPSMMKGLGQRYRASGKYDISKMDFIKQELSAKFTKRSTDTDRGMLDDDGASLNAVGKELLEQAKAEGEVEGSEKVESVNEAGEPVYFLPIYYTKNKTHDVGKKLPLADQSFDIASLYFNYLKMAIDFSNKYEILAELEMTNYFIQNRDVIRRDEKGNVLIDATAKKMSNIGESIRDRALTKSGHNSMLAAQVEDFMKSVVYGMEKDEEPDMNLFGFKIDQAKALDAVNSFTAINLLGVNFIAGLANVNLGEITQLNEAIAGQYTTTKDLRLATGYYYKNLGGIINDIGTRRPVNVVSLLNERFNTLNEEIDGKLNLNSKFANLMKTNTAFFISHAGEHYMQTRFMLAMLKTLKAVDKAGNVLGSMLDFISVDEETNTLKIDEKVANFTEEDQINFSIKMHRVLTAMHGEYSRIGQSAIQRKAIGRMGLLFRKFAIPGFKRRWQAGRTQAKAWGKQGIEDLVYSRKYYGINNLLEEYTEGYYRTFGRVVAQFMRDLMHSKYEMMDAYGRTGKDKLTDWEKANLLRFQGEVASFLVTLIIIGIITRLQGGDDDRDNLALDHAAYQALRLRSELAFFINPMATMQILRSPMASMSLFENVFKLAGQLFYPVYSGTFSFQEYEQGTWKGHLKLEKTFYNLIPGLKQKFRFFEVGDQLSWFKQ